MKLNRGSEDSGLFSQAEATCLGSRAAFSWRCCSNRARRADREPRDL